MKGFIEVPYDGGFMLLNLSNIVSIRPDEENPNETVVRMNASTKTGIGVRFVIPLSYPEFCCMLKKSLL